MLLLHYYNMLLSNKFWSKNVKMNFAYSGHKQLSHYDVQFFF